MTAIDKNGRVLQPGDQVKFQGRISSASQFSNFVMVPGVNGVMYSLHGGDVEYVAPDATITPAPLPSPLPSL